jgi:arabinogalactan oligomer/maltooligosaccharide transport system permease protein
MDYKYASVLAVMIFVVLAPFAIFNFRRTKSFKEGRV